MTGRMETFSYLPPLTPDEVQRQVEHILDSRLIPAIEYTADPGPRNTYWSMWKLPLFDAAAAEEVLEEVRACSEANPGAYVKLIGYDPRRQGQVSSFVVRSPMDG